MSSHLRSTVTFANTGNISLYRPTARCVQHEAPVGNVLSKSGETDGDFPVVGSDGDGGRFSSASNARNTGVDVCTCVCVPSCCHRRRRRLRRYRLRALQERAVSPPKPTPPKQQLSQVFPPPDGADGRTDERATYLTFTTEICRVVAFRLPCMSIKAHVVNYDYLSMQ